MKKGNPDQDRERHMRLSSSRDVINTALVQPPMRERGLTLTVSSLELNSPGKIERPGLTLSSKTLQFQKVSKAYTECIC